MVPGRMWAGVHTGTTSLVTLALVSAGEKPDSPTVRAALEYLRRFRPEELRKTYAIALQTMVFAAAEPVSDQLRITENVAWLERAQIRPGDSVTWPGSWTYDDAKRRAATTPTPNTPCSPLMPAARWVCP